eukprot:COSAG02_NODE_6815_length_3346_cov_3.046504_1_plen_97_part_10
MVADRGTDAAGSTKATEREAPASPGGTGISRYGTDLVVAHYVQLVRGVRGGGLRRATEPDVAGYPSTDLVVTHYVQLVQLVGGVRGVRGGAEADLLR